MENTNRNEAIFLELSRLVPNQAIGIGVDQNSDLVIYVTTKNVSKMISNYLKTSYSGLKFSIKYIGKVAAQ